MRQRTVRNPQGVLVTTWESEEDEGLPGLPTLPGDTGRIQPVGPGAPIAERQKKDPGAPRRRATDRNGSVPVQRTSISSVPPPPPPPPPVVTGGDPWDGHGSEAAARAAYDRDRAAGRNGYGTFEDWLSAHQSRLRGESGWSAAGSDPGVNEWAKKHGNGATVIGGSGRTGSGAGGGRAPLPAMQQWLASRTPNGDWSIPPAGGGGGQPGGPAFATGTYQATQNPNAFGDPGFERYLASVTGGQAPRPGALPGRSGPEMGEAQPGGPYDPTAAPGAAPDFRQITNIGGVQRGPQYNRTATPGASPNFQELADIGDATRGPQYRTAEGGFGGEALSPDLEAYARRLIESPNVYDSGFVKDSLGVINADLDRSRKDAVRGIEERMSARGTLGGSPEWIEGYDLEERLAREDARRRNDLAKQIAEAEMAGRGLGLSAGLGVGEFQRGLGQDRRNEGQFQWSADRSIGRDLEDDVRARAGLKLEGGRMQEDATRFRSNFGQRENQFGFQADRQRERDMEADKLNRADLGLRGGVAAEDAARFRSTFQQAENQYGQQFNRQVGRDAEEDSRFRFQAGEQQYQTDVQANLQRDAMTLDAYRTDVNAGMQAAQMRLTQLGMKSDEAFRYAQMAQDGTFRQKALELQSQGMRLDEAFRQAELSLRGELGRGELAIRGKESEANMGHNKLMGDIALYDFVSKAVRDGWMSPDQAKAMLGNSGAPVPTGADYTDVADPNQRTSFPQNPKPGQQHVQNGVTWVYVEQAPGRFVWVQKN